MNETINKTINEELDPQFKNIEQHNMLVELQEIKCWFTENDWKVNKIVIGEWSTTDNRWLDYLSERTIKRTRQDELNDLLNADTN